MFTVHMRLYWWKKYSTVGQEKSALSKSGFYGEMDMGLSCGKQNFIKVNLVHRKELSGFKYCYS